MLVEVMLDAGISAVVPDVFVSLSEITKLHTLLLLNGYF